MKYKILQQWGRLSIFVVNLILYSNFVNVFACIIRWLIYPILSGYCLPGTVLENCLETPGPKPFSTSCAKLRYPFVCSLGIFSDSENLELLTVILSFEDLLSHLTFACFILFLTIAIFVDSLNHIFFPLDECHPHFFMRRLLHISFNFPAKLSCLILCDCHTMLFH